MQHAPSDAKKRYDALFLLRFHERCVYPFSFSYWRFSCFLFSCLLYRGLYSRLGLYSRVVCFSVPSGSFSSPLTIHAHTLVYFETSCILVQTVVELILRTIKINFVYFCVKRPLSSSKDLNVNSLSLKTREQIGNKQQIGYVNLNLQVTVMENEIFRAPISPLDFNFLIYVLFKLIPSW